MPHELTGWVTQPLTKKQKHILVFSPLSAQVEAVAWNNKNEWLQAPCEKDENFSKQQKRKQ